MSEGNVLEVVIPHGTVKGYKKFKCRKKCCRDAWGVYMASYRKRRMQRTGETMNLGRFVKIG